VSIERRGEPFYTLARSIVGQQISVKAAQSIWNRVAALAPAMQPAEIIALRARKRRLKAAGLSGPRWVASIEPSRTADGRCYVCLDGHRSDDDKPYLFVTEDYGASWKPVVGNLPAFGSTRVLREDYTNPLLAED
jgi:hypothetical protein